MTPAPPNPAIARAAIWLTHTFTNPKRARQSDAGGPFPISGLGTVDVKDPLIGSVWYIPGLIGNAARDEAIAC